MSTARRTARLVGRDAQRETLRSALSRARAGEPQVVVVEGDAGTGKTALVSAVLAEVSTSIATGALRCDPAEAGVAFASAELLLGDLRDALSTVEVGRRLLAWFGELQSGGAVGVLVLDDVQWMDAQSIRAFRFALRRLRADAALVVVVRRPPRGADPWFGLDAAGREPTHIRLGPIDASDVRELARAMHGWDLDPLTLEHLIDRTGGLPLLVHAVLRDATDPADLASRDLPRSAAAAARRMMASLGADERALVDAVAVLASPTDLVAAGRVADIEQPSAALDAALASGLLIRRDAQVDCAHDLLRDAVLDAVAPTRLRELHARAATWVTGDRRLAHRFAAADRPDDDLVSDLVSAAARARRAGRFEAAATQLVRARAVSGDAARREDLLLAALVDAIRGMASDTVQALAGEARALPASASKDFALGLLATEDGDVALAKQLLYRAAQGAEQADDRDLQARAGLALAELHLSLNEPDDAITATADALVVADGELAHDLRTHRALGLWQQGDLAASLQLLDAAPSAAPTARWQPDMLAARGMVRTLAGDLDGALTDLDAAVSATGLWRSGSNHSRALIFRASTRYFAGDWDGAAVDAAAARVVAEAHVHSWTGPMALAVSSHVPANRGQWELAADYLQRARDGLRAVHATQVVGAVIAGEVLLAIAREDWPTVHKTLAPLRNETVMAMLGRARTFRWMMTNWVAANLHVGDDAQAADSLVEYETALTRWPGGPIPARLGWLKGQLAEARNEPDAARSHYLTDLADPALATTPFLHAQVLHTAGRLDRVTGRRRDAIEKISSAQGIFERLRAAPFVAHCGADLAACGLSAPTAHTLSDTANRLLLTEREEDVAGLVVRGYTNKEIAAELFVTVKTVEYHLGNVYAKLGVPSRRELRRRQPAPIRTTD